MPERAAPIGVGSSEEEDGCWSNWSEADNAASCCFGADEESGAWAAAAVATVAAAVATVLAAVATVAAAAEAPETRDEVEEAAFRGFGKGEERPRAITDDWLELAVEGGGDRRGEAFLRLESRGRLCPRLDGSRSRRVERESRGLRPPPAECELTDRRRDRSRTLRGLGCKLTAERGFRRGLVGRRADWRRAER